MNNLDRINVRRMLDHIKNNVSYSLEQNMFESKNDELLKSHTSQAINEICERANIENHSNKVRSIRYVSHHWNKNIKRWAVITEFDDSTPNAQEYSFRSLRYLKKFRKKDLKNVLICDLFVQPKVCVENITLKFVVEAVTH